MGLLNYPWIFIISLKSFLACITKSSVFNNLIVWFNLSWGNKVCSSGCNNIAYLWQKPSDCHQGMIYMCIYIVKVFSWPLGALAPNNCVSIRVPCHINVMFLPLNRRWGLLQNHTTKHMAEMAHHWEIPIIKEDVISIADTPLLSLYPRKP